MSIKAKGDDLYAEGQGRQANCTLMGYISMNTMTRMIAVIFAATIFVSSYNSWADDSGFYTQWQLDRLFQPTQQDLDLEQDGEVFIYSGIKDDEITRAMDQFYDRISSMMFVDTIRMDNESNPSINPETDEEEIDDDGC